METKKSKCGNYNIVEIRKGKLYLICLLMIIIGLIIAFLCIRDYNNINKITCNHNETYNIPTSNVVTDICKSKGYDNGFISSNICDNNMVWCYKKIGDLSKDKCESIYS